MWFKSELLAKLISQLGLFAIFLWFFGIPAIKRYQKQEVMVISSIEHSGGILAPTVSVVVRNPSSMKGWKSDNITSSVEVIKLGSFNISCVEEKAQDPSKRFSFVLQLLY